MVINGNAETKELKDMMPEIIKQVGPQQFAQLKNLMEQVKGGEKIGEKPEEEEDDVPDLVDTNFEEAAKKWEGDPLFFNTVYKKLFFN